MRTWVAWLVAVPLLAACSGGTGSDQSIDEATSDEATITISGFSFGEPLTVPAGTEVMVVNEDQATHTWTSNQGLWDSGNLAPGASFSHTFEEPGEYAFFCAIHSTMGGSLTVSG
jgi:plastocyanin